MSIVEINLQTNFIAYIYMVLELQSNFIFVATKFIAVLPENYSKNRSAMCPGTHFK